MILLEYNEQDGSFHFNMLEYVSGTRGYKALSLCDYALASDFANEYSYQGLSYNEICKRWEFFFNTHREDFLKTCLK